MKRQTFLFAATLLVGFAPTLRAGDGESRMILRLADGTRVRGIVREVDAGYEVKSGATWKLVEEKDVVGARAERDVLAERRKKLDETPDNHLGKRVEVCRWMIEQGLDPEATDELDRILRVVPEERHVLLLLEKTPPRIDLGIKVKAGESLRDELLREGARTCNVGSSAVRREMVVKAIAAAEGIAMAPATRTAEKAAEPASVPTSVAPADPSRAQPKPLRDVLVDELGSSIIARRTFACLALRRLYPATTIGPLAVHAVLDPAGEVRDEAILSLREAKTPAACAAVVQALANPSPLVRNNAIEALGRIGYPEGVAPLIKLMIAANAAAQSGSGGGPVRANIFVGLQTTYVQDFNVEIAQAASIADPIINVLQSGVLFDVGVGGMSTVSITTEIWTASRSLVRLTGARIGADPPAWEKWWNENRHRYVPEAKRDTGTKDS